MVNGDTYEDVGHSPPVPGSITLLRAIPVQRRLHGMTQRSVTQRLAAWLMVALLALIVGEPLRAHVCPMHDGSVLMLLADGASGRADPARAAHGSGHESAVPGASSAAHGIGHGAGDVAGTQSDRAPAPHSCQCLGTCCVTAPVATPVSAVAMSLTTTLVATGVVAPAVPVAVPGTGDVVLPFAIGPPRAV